MTERADHRHHVASNLMRESLVDADLLASTESPVFRMLPDAPDATLRHGIGRVCRMFLEVGAW